jgi:hypothetical protein
LLPEVPDFDSLLLEFTKVSMYSNHPQDANKEPEWDQGMLEAIDSRSPLDLLNVGIKCLQMFVEGNSETLAGTEILELVEEMLGQWLRYRSLLQGEPTAAPTTRVGGSGFLALRPPESPPRTPIQLASTLDIPGTRESFANLDVSPFVHLACRSFMLILS